MSQQPPRSSSFTRTRTLPTPFGDDELAPVAVTTSGGGRVTTPSKAVPQTRNSSAPRASSATKDRNLFRAIHETETEQRAPSRAPSRRKARQLENDSLAGLHRALVEKGINIDFHEGDGEDGGVPHPRTRVKYGIRIHIKSMFAELFEDKNAFMREEFRTCAVGTAVGSSASSSSGAHRSSRRPAARADQRGQADEAWYRIEHRLRR